MSSKRIIIFIFLFIINIIVVFVADHYIKLGHWHYGKDAGFFARANFNFIMSPLFYFILAKKYKIIFALAGLIIGGLSIALSYLIIIPYTDLSDIYYHFLSVLLFITSFF